MSKEIKVLVADYIDAPVSYGMVAKYVLLPSIYEEKYTSDELYLVLLHELSHIKNGDTIKYRIINLLQCLMWFNPTVHLFCKKFRQDTEILCDNQVMSVQKNEREVYGHLLIKGCSSRNNIIGYGFSDSFFTVKGRIEALYHCKAMKHSFYTISSLVVLLFMAANSMIHYTFSNNLKINKDYSSVFEISLNNLDYTSIEYLDSDFCSKIYEIKDGEILISKTELRELAADFSESDYEVVVIDTKSFTYATNQFIFTVGDKYRIHFDEILADAEDNSCFSYPLCKRSPVEYMFLQITNKI